LKQIAEVWAVTMLLGVLAVSMPTSAQKESAAPSKKEAARKPAQKPAKKPTQSKLIIRIERKGWGKAGLTDIQKVLESAGGELWRQFPHRQLKPISVRKSKKGPMVLYRREANGQYQVLLNTGDLYWAQYSYQFAHELCHILCNYRAGKNPNKWFEESLCELASLYALRSMSKTWKTSPPYPNWKNYAPALHKYAQKRIDDSQLSDLTLAKWYKQNESVLRSTATDRKKNNIVATALLSMFESEPHHWQAISYLNKGKGSETESFSGYLRRWHAEAPKKHKPFIGRIAGKFGISLN